MTDTTADFDSATRHTIPILQAVCGRLMLRSRGEPASAAQLALMELAGRAQLAGHLGLHLLSRATDTGDALAEDHLPLADLHIRLVGAQQSLAACVPTSATLEHLRFVVEVGHVCHRMGSRVRDH